MSWQLLLSLRYLTARRKEKFISVISLISVCGIAIGVAALIIVISVMSGFDEDLREKIIGTYSHIEILSDYGIQPSAGLAAKLMKTSHVSAFSFFTNGQALARYGQTVTGVIVKGVVPQNEVKVNKLGEYLKEGSLDLAGSPRASSPGDAGPASGQAGAGVVIGSELADRLGARVGDTVSFISPSAFRTNRFPMLGNFKVEGMNFRVAGIFTSGMYEYDSNLVYMDIAAAQALFGSEGLASGISIKVDDVLKVDDAKRALRNSLGAPYTVRTWMELNRNLLAALKLEKTVMFIILTLIIIVACFNIGSTLIMTVLEKTRDIGILKAIGSTSFNVMAIFALQGMMIGVIGTLVGAGCGVAACWCLKTYRFIALPKEIYYIDRLPVRIDPYEVSLIVTVSILISLVAAIYPAYRASRLDPVEALRYE